RHFLHIKDEVPQVVRLVQVKHIADKMLDAASQHIVKDRGVIDNGQFYLRENLIDIIGVVPEKQIRMVFVELFHLLVVAVAAHQGVHFENQEHMVLLELLHQLFHVGNGLFKKGIGG